MGNDHTIIDIDSSVVFNAMFIPFHTTMFNPHHTLLKVDVIGNVFFPGATSLEEVPLVTAILHLIGNLSDAYFDLRTTGVASQALLHLYAIQGRLCYSAPVSDDQPVMADLSHLSSGVFHFSILSAEGKVLLSMKWVRN